MRPTPTRRRWLRATAGAGLVTVLAGCAGDDDTDDSEPGADDGDDPGADEGTELSYAVSEPRSHDEVPDDVVEHPNPEGFSWIVVELEVSAGSLDAGDVLGLTQVDVDGESHPARAVEITAPEQRLVTSSDDEYAMEAGTEACVYYRVPDGAGGGEWVTDQLTSQYPDLAIGQ